MPWATVFFPDHIRQLMNLETSLELKRASGFNISSDEVNFLNAIGQFRFLSAVSSTGRPDVSPHPTTHVATAGILRRNCGRNITLLALLGSVFRSPPLSAIDAQRIQ